jgi:hypothetical protein
MVNSALWGYSFFGIAVDRKYEAKCLFPQEKGTLHTA